MIVYRIAKAKYVHDLSGYGAYTYGGRWNEVGVYVLYTSTSRSLAMLELLVHRNGHRLDMHEFKMLKISIPDDWITDSYELSLNMLEAKDKVGSRILAREHFLNANAAAFSVASTIVPQEQNIILNPKYADYGKLEILAKESVQIDGRLL